jgi:hypothetical protein
MNKFRLVIAFFALSVCSGSSSQGQGVLSLEECVNIALEHNYGLRIVRNQEEILKNNNTLGNAGYLPVLDAAVGYDGELVNTDSESSGGQKTSHNGVYNVMQYVAAITCKQILHVNFQRCFVNVNFTAFVFFHIKLGFICAVRIIYFIITEALLFMIFDGIF